MTSFRGIETGPGVGSEGSPSLSNRAAASAASIKSCVAAISSISSKSSKEKSFELPFVVVTICGT